MDSESQVSGSSKIKVSVIITLLVIVGVSAFFLRTNHATPTSQNEAPVAGAKKLPDAWPSDAVVYPHAAITFSNTTSTQAGVNAYQIMFTTSDSVQAVSDFYTQQLTSSGWVSMYPGAAITTMQTGKVISITAKKDKRFIAVTVSEGSDNTVNVTEMVTSI